MNKENNRSAAGLRRSAIAERLRLREEWSALKGTDGPSSQAILAKKPTNPRCTPAALSRKKCQMVASNHKMTTRTTHTSSDALHGVVALVEVGEEARALPLRAALTALGASVVGSWSPLVTHLVWADGGCRASRAKARALGCRLVSPLWVEACAGAAAKLSERAFATSARQSDLPSPRSLRRLLAKNMPYLAIGLNCVLTANTKVVNSGLRGTTQALIVLAAYKINRYEFIFTNLSPNCVRHYTSVVGVHKAYAGSRTYRDLKLRGAIIHNKQLRMLPLEKICLNEQGIWNLSSDSGNLGTMVITNVRVVWYADINDAFNVSMPYITIETISIRESKFGEALVFVIRQSSGGYVLGFRADPRERLKPLLNELLALHQAYTEKPVFGVEINWNSESAKPVIDDIEELEEIGEPRGEMGPNLYLASQLAHNNEETEIQPVYSPYLGLAIEPLKEGFTLKSLFEVQTTS